MSSIIMREIKIKTTIIYHLIPIRMDIINKFKKYFSCLAPFPLNLISDSNASLLNKFYVGFDLFFHCFLFDLGLLQCQSMRILLELSSMMIVQSRSVCAYVCVCWDGY